jgi:LysR family transcriptional regulator, glycine cleavage system transcriptional activator
MSPGLSMKRLLPSLTALVAFEAAARHASFARAGEELGLTASAISRQIAQLEGFLGVSLFERVRRAVVPNERGLIYAAEIRATLDRAEAATVDVLASNDRGRILHIWTLSTLTLYWLIPRMPTFVRQNPDIAFQITTYTQPFQLSGEPDIVIHYGEPSWPGGLLHRLMDEEIVCATSPDYIKAIGLRSVRDLDRATFLQQTTRPDAWSDLLAKLGRGDLNALRGPRFDQYGVVIEAALASLGLAAVPRFLIEAHLACSRLVMPFKASVRSRHAYHLVYPEAKRQWPEVQAFRRWILREARSMQRR